MIPVADSSSVLIGNKVESIVPYHTSDEFSVVAEMNGKVVDIQDGIVVVQYSNGSYKSIDTNIQVKKNSSAGFFIETQLVCDKKIGDKVKKGEVIAYDAKTYTKNKHDLSASMNLGVLTKVAVAPSWDIYEDSLPVTESLSERLSTVMIDEKMIALDKNTFIQKIVKIGDKVRTGDPLIVFDENYDDPFVARFLESIREDMREEVIESNITTIKSKKSGEIVDIKIYSTVDMEELHPSIQDIFKEYHKRINKKVKVLNKYQNAGDMKYYKSGNIINESTDKLIPNAQGKIKGQTVNEGVLIIFYIKFKDKISKGDKIVHQSALKGVASHVIEKGYEPYSEYRPDEEISSIVAPLSITARKTPSIFLSMFGNKLLIELKRQLKEMYLGENE